MSAPYLRHRVVRQRAELERVEGMLEMTAAIRDRAKL